MADVTQISSSATPTTLGVLIVHAHPEPASFSTAQMRAAEQALRGGGARVRVIDLYEHWPAVLSRDEFPPFEGPFKPQAEQQRAYADGTLPPDVREHLDTVLEADLLILSFPLWWFSLPAVLKGWVDRVFVMGAMFGGDAHGVFDAAAMRGKRAMVLATTGGAPASFEPGGAFGDLDQFLFHIHRGMFEFVGYEVVPPVVTFGPAHLGDPERAAALQAVREKMRNLLAETAEAAS